MIIAIPSDAAALLELEKVYIAGFEEVEEACLTCPIFFQYIFPITFLMGFTTFIT